MGTRAVSRGPVAERVAANVTALRQSRGLNQRQLVERLERIGRPMLASGLSKIEQGERRVDVDDLVALAIALDATPNQLLLPAGAKDDQVSATEEVTGSAETLWRWACGDEPLPDIWTTRPSTIDLGRQRRFRRESRPHDPPDETPVSEVEQHLDVLAPVVSSIRAAQTRGLSMKTIVGYVNFVETSRRIGEWLKTRTEDDD